ncbi:MAG: PD-(D/E)XK nuclease family transposase, partial [Clostridiales bacterium]|nr:PD-(D/E)XK nuclease family transposase [Clostridiales bacterium]
MKVFFKDNYEAAELLLRIILNKPDIKVKDIKVESDLDNLEGRSVTLDVLAVDDKGAEFNVEIQRRSAGASAQRAGYHLSMMHTHMLKKEEPFEKLKDAYVIFITESDTIGENMPISVYETMNINNHKQFDDKRHIIYVNGAARCSTTKLGRLMEDFFCEEPD